MMHNVKNETTIVSTIRNRNSRLRQTLPNWLRFNIPIIIVDFRDDGCESAWDVVKDYENVTLIETKYEYTWCKGIAQNLLMNEVQTKWILSVDVDCILDDNLFEKNPISSNEFMHPGSSDGRYGSTYGTCLLRKQYWMAINGFSENLSMWGVDDEDFYWRLEKAGYKYREWLPDAVYHIPHDAKESIVNTFQSAITTEINLIDFKHRTVYDFNRKLNKIFPWTTASSRVKWHITELQDKRRFLAVRDFND